MKLAAAPDVSHHLLGRAHGLQTTGRFAFAQPEGAGDAREELEVQAAMQRNYDATILTAEANYIVSTGCPHRERRAGSAMRRLPPRRC